MLEVGNQSPAPANPKSLKRTIIVIGGAEDKVHGREILHTFFVRAGAADAKIVILPCASREPVAMGDRYRSIFAEMGAASIDVLDIRERHQAEDPIWQKCIEACTGTFMTGGDQLRLCAILADTPIMERIRMRVQQGQMVLAGTSAGAAVMGHHMIAGGGSGESPNRSLVDMATGFGILPEAIVDQHFQNRNRMARLLSAISTHPDRIGIGIDEDTCTLFEGGGMLRVLGKGTVTVIDPGEMSYTNVHRVSATDPLSLVNLRIHILTHGDSYNWQKRTPLPQSV